ncbi:MAG: cation diffusion facilitator family transporter [bacterium]
MHTCTEQSPAYRSTEKKKLILSLSITAFVMVVEIIGGFFVHSIALLSDAGHMFTHCFTIAISLIAIKIARKPLCHHRTFGLYRAEILAAFVNGIFLLMVVGIIIYKAIGRIIYPKEVLGPHMLFIALLGLTVNLASIAILHGSHKDDLNVRSVFYHILADAASSVGIVIAAVIISYTGWYIIDPLVSLGVSIVILFWAVGVLKTSGIILLEMAPAGLNVDIISDDLKNAFPEIKELTNVHLWTITSDMLVFSAHITLHKTHQSSINQNTFITLVNNHLFHHYKIIESTLQITFQGDEDVCTSTRNAFATR